jgi:hypothetical protein
MDDDCDTKRGEKQPSDGNGLCNDMVPSDRYPIIRLSVITWFVTLACLASVGSTYAMSISFGRFAGNSNCLTSSFVLIFYFITVHIVVLMKFVPNLIWIISTLCTDQAGNIVSANIVPWISDTFELHPESGVATVVLGESSCVLAFVVYLWHRRFCLITSSRSSSHGFAEARGPIRIPNPQHQISLSTLAGGQVDGFDCRIDANLRRGCLAHSAHIRLGARTLGLQDQRRRGP